MKKVKNEPGHVTRGSVFNDLGLDESESAALKVKASLYQELLKCIRKRKLSQRQLQHLLDQPQPRVSELLNGKISKMSIEKLVDYLSKLGGVPSVSVKFSKSEPRAE
jgi:predicted XRE-type DNA-binding protein